MCFHGAVDQDMPGSNYWQQTETWFIADGLIFHFVTAMYRIYFVHLFYINRFSKNFFQKKKAFRDQNYPLLILGSDGCFFYSADTGHAGM